MNSKMGYVASLFGVLVGDEFKIKNEVGYLFPALYRFTPDGLEQVKGTSTKGTPFILQQLLAGKYAIVEVE